MTIKERLTGTKEAMKALSSIPKEKLEDIRNQGIAAGHMNIIKQIMEQSGCTYEEALDMCIGENRDPECSMHWKMCEHIMDVRSEKGRAAFRELLDDDEKEVFDRKTKEVNFKKEVNRGIKKGKKDAMKGRR